MRLAIDEAKKGLGRTHPNPAVGAVIVKAGRVIATGFHARAGTAHAEANALMLAGARAKGATIYSTLEPCDHFGRTPPCTQAILDHGLSRVVYGSSDPNPLVDGKGVRRMRRAGLEVEGGVLRAECDALNEPFFKVMRSGLPFVTVKAGVTLDGKIATRTGASKWITSEASRGLAHELRNRVDAVLVGAGTVIADDPSLTTRLEGGRDALRVVLDPSLRTPPKAKVYGQGRVVVFTSERPGHRRWTALTKRGVQVEHLSRSGTGLSLREVLKRLVTLGVLHVLVEGGAETTSRFLRAGLVDELRLFVAPLVFGREGVSWSGPLGIDVPAKGLQFGFVGIERSGPDVVLVARPVATRS